jgi:hypothetical protein
MLIDPGGYWIPIYGGGGIIYPGGGGGNYYYPEGRIGIDGGFGGPVCNKFPGGGGIPFDGAFGSSIYF